jgi:sugar phosphate isomerase/epimerase
VTDEHLDAAVELLDDYGLEVVSYAGWFGASADEFEQNCAVASAVGAPLLAGSTSALEIDLLYKYGLRFAYENEAERTAGEILRKIGSDEVFGVCADTGWFGTHGLDAAETLRELAPRLLHVHLKDVRQVGSHDACRYGEGIVPLERCVRVLQEVGYAGAISIEQETSPYDPGEDVRASLDTLRGWLGE